MVDTSRFGGNFYTVEQPEKLGEESAFKFERVNFFLKELLYLV